LWAADLAKHVVDFSVVSMDQGSQVDLQAFETDFIEWLLHTHGHSSEFQQWRQQHPSDDYRTSISANIDFVWKEVNGILGQDFALSQPLFRETLHFTEYQQTVVRPLPMITQDREEAPPTIVTPFIKRCFGHMVIGKMLKAIGDDSPSAFYRPAALRWWNAPNPQVEMSTAPPKRAVKTSRGFLPLGLVRMIKEGDTISTPRDGESTDTKWRSTASKGTTDDGRWFGLVQKIHIAKNGSRSFDVTWFYRPVDTPCGKMQYPWEDELFLSNHCTCEEKREARVKEDEILGVHTVDWFGNPETGEKEFFVRQTYMVEDRKWVSLKSHLTCSHDRPKKLGFAAGDTILADLARAGSVAEPFEVVKTFRQGETIFVRLRRLLYRTVVDPEAGAAANEVRKTPQSFMLPFHLSRGSQGLFTLLLRDRPRIPELGRRWLTLSVG
jgi:DNA (cytosine-5)-methyltransferase 1